MRDVEGSNLNCLLFANNIHVYQRSMKTKFSRSAPLFILRICTIPMPYSSSWSIHEAYCSLAVLYRTHMLILWFYIVCMTLLCCSMRVAYCPSLGSTRPLMSILRIYSTLSSKSVDYRHGDEIEQLTHRQYAGAQQQAQKSAHLKQQMFVMLFILKDIKHWWGDIILVLCEHNL